MDINTTAQQIVNATNSTITNPQQATGVIVKILSAFGFVSQWLANQIYVLLGNIGLHISTFGAGILLFLVFFGLLFLVAKIAKPVVKIIFWILLAILIIGIFLP